jgi:FHS family L-fucose permease-like MFS transporter
MAVYFALAINGLGKHTNQGPVYDYDDYGRRNCKLIQGYIADITNIHFSYIVGVICFAYLAFYAIRVSGILKSQGIDLDKITKGSGH